MRQARHSPLLLLAAALVALAVLFAPGAPPPAQASSHVLVSNIGQTPGHGNFDLSTASTAWAQGFTTGSQSGGYTLGSIEVVIKNAPTTEAQRDTVTAELWSAVASGSNAGKPDAKLADLTVPDHPITAGTVKFTAPANTTLAASTAYVFIIYTTGSFNLGLPRTASTDEDSDSATGWSINDNNFRPSSGTDLNVPSGVTTWGTASGASYAVRIAVNGPELSPTDLADLDFRGREEGGSLQRMRGASAMVPAFDAGTTSYRATVGNNVTHVALIFQPAVTGSTLQAGRSGGALTAVPDLINGVDFALEVGANEFTVRVTAADNTTQDYTVTVRRVPAGSVWWATLTADEIDEYSGCDDVVADQEDCSDALTDNDFTYAGVTHTVKRFYIDDEEEELAVEGDVDFPSDSLILNVDGTQFSTDDDTDTDADWWVWGTTLDWADNQLVSVSLAQDPNAPQTLVSNLGQEAQTTFRGTGRVVQAQGFTAGGNAGGYTLTSIEAAINSNPTQTDRDNIRAQLWSANASGAPNAKLADLTVPPHPITAGTVLFQAPENTALSAGVKYFLVLYTTTDFNLQIHSTGPGAEDAGGAAGWDISDAFHVVTETNEPATTSTWGERGAANAALKIRVRGSAAQAQLSATDLSALVIRGGDGGIFHGLRGASVLVPAFGADTTTYRATVGNDVTFVNCQPELADASSSVQVGRSDGGLAQIARGTVSSDIALEVGDNDFTVRVTDTNGNTKDYTVTVRRVASGTEWWATFRPGEFSAGGGDFVGCVSQTDCDSELTDNSVAVGGETNHFDRISLKDDSNELSGHLGNSPNSQLQALKFCVGPTEFSIGSTFVAITATSALGWTAGVPVSLSIGTSCAPPPPVTLVSNLDQDIVSGGGVDAFRNVFAQGFTTGISGGGYTLTNFDVNVGNIAPQAVEQVRAELWSANPDGGPQSKLAELTVPTSISSGTTMSLQAPPGTTLAPRTTYYLLLYTTAILTFTPGITHSADEDTGGAAGWSIADRNWYAPGNDPSTVTSWTRNYDPDYPQRRRLITMSVHGRAHGEPAAPTPANLSAEPGGGKVNLSWEITRTPSDSPRSRYNIEYGEHPDGPLTLARTGAVFATNPSYVIEGLTPGTTYRFRVQTAGTFGFRIGPSSWSEWVTATPVSPPPPPTGLTVEPGFRQLELSWTAPAGTLTGYEVYYTASATVEADIPGGTRINPATGWRQVSRGTESDPPEAAQTISGLTNLTTYRVRVRAKDATGESTWAGAAGTPFFPTPTGLKVAPGNARLTVSWTAPPVAVTGYDVHYKEPDAPDQVATTVGNPSTGWVGASPPSTETTVTIGLTAIDRLANNTTYVIRVRAKDGMGRSAWVESRGTPKATITGSSDATLSGLLLTDPSGTSVTFDLTPGFESTKYAYTADVGRDQAAVRVTLEVNEPNATATVNGTVVTIDAPGGAIDISLESGLNRITVRVTAQNGTTQDYTIDVTRGLPSVNMPQDTNTVPEGLNYQIRMDASGSIAMRGTLTYGPGAANPASPAADLGGAQSTTFTMTASDAFPSIITIPIDDDSLNEEHETFTVTINPGIGYVVGSPATQTVTITDNDPPAAPGDLSLRARDGRLSVNWSRPDGPVTGYKVRWKTTAATDQAATMTGDPSTGWVEGSEVTATSQQITGLTNDTSYDVQVQATDGQSETGNGYGPWSDSQSETPVLSPDADLSALTAESSADGATFATLTLDQTFAPGTTAYTATVAHEVTHARVTPTLSDSNASMQVGKGTTLETVGSGTASNAVALEVGDNAITVRVTAQNGTTMQDYTVTVTRRPSSDSTLKGLTASSNDEGAFLPLTLTPSAFDPAVTAYTASVPNSATRVRLTPTVNHSGAMVQVGKGANLQSVTSGTASNAVDLEVGDNAIIVRVTAQDRATTQNYTVTVTRRMEPRVSLAARPNPVREGWDVTIEAKLSDVADRDVTIPVLLRWGSEFRNGQVTDYGDLDQGDLDGYGTSSVTEDANGNRYQLYTVTASVKVSSGAHQRSYGLQRIGTNRDADSRHETFTVMLDSDSPSWPAGVVEPGSPASVKVTVRDADDILVAPGPPTDVWVWPGDQRLDLSWDPPSTGGSPTTYEVHYTSQSRHQVGDNAAPVDDPTLGWADSGVGGLTFPAITGLANDTRYQVRIRAVNDSGKSAWAFGSGTPQAPEYDPHRDSTRATLGSIVVHYDGDPPVDDFERWQPAHLANYGYRVRIPGEFSYLDPDDNSVRFALTTHAKIEVQVGRPGSTLRVGKVTYPGADQSDPQATPPVDCSYVTVPVSGSNPVSGEITMYRSFWRCVALAAVTAGELSHAIELNAHSPNTHVDIEVTDGEVVRTHLLNIDPPARTYSLSPTAQVEEGQDARLTLTLGREAPAGGLEFAVTTAYGTARGDDLGAVASPVIVPEGGNSLEITVPTVDDDRYEGDESFTVSVAPTGSGWAVDPEGTDTATVTINDNDAAPEGPEPRAVRFVPGDGTLTVSWTVAPREDAEDGEIRHALRWSQTTGADHFWANPRDPHSVGPSDGITVAGGVTSYVITSLENGVATRVDLRSYTGSNHSEGGPKSSRWVTEEGEHTTPRGGQPQQQTPAARTYAVTDAARAVEGGAATLTVTLSEAAPQGGVEFSVAAGYSATATADDVGAVTSPVTVAQGNTTLDIAIPTAADAVDEDDETFTVTIAASTAGWEKAGDGRDTATVTIADDDSAGVTVNAANPFTVAEGGTATYTVVLDSRPTADVTVTASSGDDGAATVSPASQTFTPSAWNTPLTFTVSGVADDDTQDESMAISHGVSSDDGKYVALLANSVAVTVSDTTAGAPQQAQSPQAKYADLIAKVYEWRNDPRYVDDKAHTDRWDRVLLTFGETVVDTTLTIMTSAEAKTYVNRGWTRWIEVAKALREMENRAPTLSSALADVTIVNESGTHTVSLSGVFSDADNDALTITEVSSDQAVATILAATDQSSLTVNAHTRGTATGTITADDGWGGTVSDTFTITVKAAPVVASALADVSGLKVEATRDLSLSGVFSDADRDALTVTAGSDDVAIATVTVAANYSALTIRGVSGGTATVTVTAQDSDGNTVRDAFDVSVVAPQHQGTPNRAPTVASAIGDATIVNESGVLEVSLTGVFSDADSDSLTVTAASSNDAVSTVSVAAGYSTLTVTAKSKGTATITVTADDGNGGTVSNTFTVTVKAAPVVASAIADVSGLEVDATQDVSLSGVFSDADGDNLTITANSSDNAITTVTVAADRSKLTVSGVAQGTATITVTAQDADGNQVSAQFDVTVINRSPTVAAALGDARIAHLGGRHSVSLSGTFADADNDSLTITAASSNDDAAKVSVAPDHSSLTVTGVAQGTATVTVTADDGNGGKVADAFTVTVKSAPTLASARSDASVLAVGGRQDIVLSNPFDNPNARTVATSDDDDVASVSVLPDHTLTVSALAMGTATVTVTARDASDRQVVYAFDVAVASSFIADVSDLEIGGDQDVSLLGVFHGADGDALTITAASSDDARAAVTVAADQSRLTLTGMAEGTATITVTAEDTDGNRVSDAFDVAVVAAESEVEGDGPPPVENLRCIAETSRVAFLWDAPEWSGGEVYAYDYRLILPGGRSESGRLVGGTVLYRPGDYQQGAETSVSVKTVYELADGKQVSSAEETLACTVE